MVAAVAVSYFYSDTGEEEKTLYTAGDFPNALQMMNEEILQASLEDLNKQYRRLEEGDEHIFIRWNNIGILKKRLGDYVGTEQAWLKAAEHNPNQILVIGNLADLYAFDLKDSQKAEEYYKRALSSDSYNYNYYIGLATLYRYKMTEKSNLIESLMLSGIDKFPSEAENHYMYLANYFFYGADDNGGDDLQKAKHYTQETLKLNSELKEDLPDL